MLPGVVGKASFACFPLIHRPQSQCGVLQKNAIQVVVLLLQVIA